MSQNLIGDISLNRMSLTICGNDTQKTMPTSIHNSRGIKLVCRMTPTQVLGVPYMLSVGALFPLNSNLNVAKNGLKYRRDETGCRPSGRRKPNRKNGI